MQTRARCSVITPYMERLRRSAPPNGRCQQCDTKTKGHGNPRGKETDGSQDWSRDATHAVAQVDVDTDSYGVCGSVRGSGNGERPSFLRTSFWSINNLGKSASSTAVTVPSQ